MEVADSADISHALSTLPTLQLMENFTKILGNFNPKNCFNIFLIPQNFFRSSLFFQNINFFDTLNNREDAKKLWKILRNFKGKNCFK